jgi:hypothetical protein
MRIRLREIKANVSWQLWKKKIPAHFSGEKV